MEELDPAAFAHFTYHQGLLNGAGIRLEAGLVTNRTIELTVQQVDEQELSVPHAELKERARAIFRFYPYIPRITVLLRIGRGVSAFRVAWPMYPYYPAVPERYTGG